MTRLPFIAAVALSLALPASASAQAMVSAISFTGVEGRPLGKPRVVDFDDVGPCNPSAYAVTVTWGPPGDGSSPASVDRSSMFGGGRCEYFASADHTYAQAGTYAFSVTVCNGATCAAPAQARAAIAEAPVGGDASDDLTAVAGQPFSGTVATITDGNPLAQVGDFAATIDWGDQTPPTPGSLSGAGGTYRWPAPIPTPAPATTASWSPWRMAGSRSSSRRERSA